MGGTILKSARSDRFRTPEGRIEAAEQLNQAEIDALVAIGGDGTLKGAAAFFEEHRIPVIGCPGTIDNDLFGTDETIGYDTALNTQHWRILISNQRYRRCTQQAVSC